MADPTNTEVVLTDDAGASINPYETIRYEASVSVGVPVGVMGHPHFWMSLDGENVDSVSFPPENSSDPSPWVEEDCDYLLPQEMVWCVAPFPATLQSDVLTVDVVVKPGGDNIVDPPECSVRDDGAGIAYCSLSSVFPVLIQVPPTCYSLSLSVHGGSGGTPNATTPSDCSGGKYTAGTTVNLAASPASDWRVAHWHGTSNDSSTATTNSVTMTSDKSVSVHYELIPACYSLSVSVHGGSGGTPAATTPSHCSGGKYEAGTIVNLLASPASGWRVAHWHGTSNDASDDSSNLVTMTSDKSASVHYELIPAGTVRRAVLFINGIGHPGGCYVTPDGEWDWLQEALADTADTFFRYVYSSGSKSAPDCWKAGWLQSGTKQDACWSLDDTYKDFFGTKDVPGGGQAGRLQTFIQRFLAQADASVKLSIVGHSQGGLLATYVVTNLLSVAERSRIETIVTLDSPLRGINGISPNLLREVACMISTDPKLDSAFDMSCTWGGVFKGCSDIVKDIQVPSTFGDSNLQLFTVNEQGWGPWTPFEYIDDAHSTVPWATGHIPDLHTGNHETIWHPSPPDDKLTQFIVCAISRLITPSGCRDWAEDQTRIHVSQLGSQVTNYNVPHGSGAFQTFTAWGGSTVTTTLTSPSGIVIDAGTISPNVKRVVGPTTEGFTVADPEPGEWTIHLYGLDVPASGEDVQLFATDIPGSSVDGDGDLIRNEDDNCPLTRNGSQGDADNDGIGDACDGDNDDDGVANSSDNCEFITNPSQADGNVNGVGDACDPDLNDTDGDGVLDGVDNCPLDANAGQEDGDDDGLGDACDEPGLDPAMQGDTDCDGDVDTVDVLNVLRDSAALTVLAQCLASSGDIDCDVDRDAADALGILRHVALLPVSQPQGCVAIGDEITSAQASSSAGPT